MPTPKRMIGLAVLVTTLTPGRVTFAQTQPALGAEATGGAPADPTSRRSLVVTNAGTWYGYQTLACDVAGVALFTAGVLVTNASQSPVVGVSIGSAGGFVYLLGGPIVHLVHGRDTTAVVDIGMRAAVPFLSTFVGALIGLKAGWGGGWAFGASLGVAAVMAFDASAFAWDPQAPAGRPSVSITPMVRVVREAGGPARPFVGVGGTF